MRIVPSRMSIDGKMVLEADYFGWVFLFEWPIRQHRRSNRHRYQEVTSMENTWASAAMIGGTRGAKIGATIAGSGYDVLQQGLK